MTGAFKERGALNKILLLSPEEARARGHCRLGGKPRTGRGLSRHAPRHSQHHRDARGHAAGEGDGHAGLRRRGDPARRELRRGLPARARRWRPNAELTFLHPFDDLAVIAGQGTIGLELLEQCPQLEAVVVPVGGGGLIAGVACAIKELRPAVKVVGVQTARLPSMVSALAQRAPVTIPSASTIADGIAVRRAGEITYPLVAKYVDEIVTVEEEEIASAILTLLEREKMLAEGAGAAATAALLQHKTKLNGQHTAVLVGGGNIDVSLLSRIIERGLVKDGRLVRIRIYLPDRPGALAELSSVIAGQKANIVELHFDRAYYGVSLGDTAIDVTLETRGASIWRNCWRPSADAGYTHERIL